MPGSHSRQDTHPGAWHRGHGTHPASFLTLLDFILQAADFKEGRLCRLRSGAAEDGWEWEGQEARNRGRKKREEAPDGGGALRVAEEEWVGKRNE